ncbi:vancomycin resistance protein [Paenibacillus baekrokdamisoli]|uniref:Vancomycin resistance protein n=1 Tax=Paenibacillus baekrokdamisoli TaxID=1712516 RepID=A0A3G9IYF0_9BACL|nr:VanW family protein [Paenibacillus baekrokdamisoli]MBB3073312.1 vancomycin resistance protein YoaR [Paenibacillus baekrokdamisoli]BBH23937.1 vancomycin resistance protein [Paenibacillus baekrokdamisoli]
MKKLHLIIIITASLLLVSSAGWGLIWIYSSRDEIPKGVRINASNSDPLVNGSGTAAGKNEQVLHSKASFAIGGLSIKNALLELTQREETLANIPLTIEVNSQAGQQHTWTLAELGILLDTKAAKAAIIQLQEGSIWDKMKIRMKFPETLLIEIRWNKQTFLSKIKGQWGFLNANEPSNAARSITADDKVVYRAHSDAYRLDAEAMFSKAQQAVEAIIAKDWGASAGGASASGGIEGQQAVTLPLAMRVVHPDITLERLKAEGIDRKITSFTTDFRTSGTGRAYNVSTTAKTLNDWELAPGEVFDYSKVISLTSRKYGFREAPVILNGELVPGIGGGICQVSSTLYNAALLAGLNMVERRNHSLPVSYLPKGQDATFAEGAINFRFKNTTGHYLLIRTVVQDRQLTVKLFGTMSSSVSYKIDSTTVTTIEPPIKEVANAVVQPGGRLLLTAGKPGFVVETYRTKLENGKEVSRERISRDTYKPQPVIYGVSVEDKGLKNNAGAGKNDSNSGKKLLEDGVAE